MEPNIRDDSVPELDQETLPTVSVTLLSCVHYHLDPEAFRAYLRVLADNSIYLVLVTEEDAHDIMAGDSDTFVKMIGPEWKIVHRINTSEGWLKAGDGHKNLTSIVLRSRHLQRLCVADCFRHQIEASEVNRHFYLEVFPKFIADILAGQLAEPDLPHTEVYRWQVESGYGSRAWGPEIALQRTQSYFYLVQSIREHGQEKPIDLLCDSVDQWDGHHRIAILNHLGIKWVYAKKYDATDEDIDWKQTVQRVRIQPSRMRRAFNGWCKGLFAGQQFAHVLNLGCGHDVDRQGLTYSGYFDALKVTRADPAAQTIYPFEEGCLSGGLRFRNPVDVVCQAESLPFESETFDMVFCNWVIYHTEYERALDEIRRVLCQGGKLYVSYYTELRQSLIWQAIQCRFKILAYTCLQLDRDLDGREGYAEAIWGAKQ